MTHPTDCSRRSVLTGAVAGTGALLIGAEAHAVAGAHPAARPLGAVWKIAGATILTMDKAIGDLRHGDVLVRNGRIAKVAAHIDAPDAEVIDGAGRIVFPGFIDSHTHMWQTQMRGMFGQTKGALFFPLTNAVDDAFRPQDIAVSMRMTAWENVAAGITSSCDFFDNNRGPAFAEAALVDMPIRKRLLYGNASKTTEGGIDLVHLKALMDGWSSRPDTQSLGMAWRLPKVLSDKAMMAMKRREYDFARSHGLPVAVHVSGPQHDAMFRTVIDGGFLFPGLQVIHASEARAADLEALEVSGASLCLTPLTEHRVGFGLTLYDRYKHISRLGLGVDGNGLAGAADMFAIMRLLAMTQIGASHDQTSVDPHHLFEMATIGGAKTMGVDDQLGSLTPGKLADIAMVDTRALNLGMVGEDPETVLIFSAGPQNVEFVSVGGRAVKRDYQLIGLDREALRAEIAESVAHLKAARQKA